MKRKGLPILVGVLLIIFNFLVHLFFPGTWFAETELLLHLGLVLAILGQLIADVIG